jgi:hypothetical protein
LGKELKKIYVTKNDQDRIVAVDADDQPYLSRHGNMLRSLEPGEIATYYCDASPSAALTAWHILLCKAVFDAQERFATAKALRGFLYIMSGYSMEIKCGRKKITIPKSWSWDDLPNDFERAELHEKVVAAMHDEYVQSALWPHLRKPKRMEMMLDVIAKAEAERDALRRSVADLIEAGNNLRAFAMLFSDDAPQVALREWDKAKGTPNADR